MMGITTEMARKHAKSLEDKGLLSRVRRHGQSNAFDLKATGECATTSKPENGRVGNHFFVETPP
jgi:predicted ArsR family transcriptional regulator